MHAHISTYIYIYTRTRIHASVHKYIPIKLPTYLHRYIPPCPHACIHPLLHRSSEYGSGAGPRSCECAHEPTVAYASLLDISRSEALVAYHTPVAKSREALPLQFQGRHGRCLVCKLKEAAGTERAGVVGPPERGTFPLHPAQLRWLPAPAQHTLL